MKRYNFIKGMNSNLELSDKERRRILRRSVEKDPWKLKCTIAMEEFAELQQQVSKEIRGYHDQYGLKEIQKAIDVKLYREKGNLK